jgi:hypothetical protein
MFCVTNREKNGKQDQIINEKEAPYLKINGFSII